MGLISLCKCRVEVKRARVLKSLFQVPVLDLWGESLKVRLSLKKSSLTGLLQMERQSAPPCSISHPPDRWPVRQGKRSSQSEDRNALYKISHPLLPPKLP